MRDRAYRREKARLKKQKKIFIINNCGYQALMGCIKETPNGCYITGYRPLGRTKVYKKISRKVTRRNAFGNHSSYRKAYDLWWNID